MLDDLSKARATLLAKYGGYSHRYIAEVVLNDWDRKTVKAVSRYLQSRKIRVTEFRDGNTKEAQARSREILRRKRKYRRTA